jgi:hypothetical protein
MISNSSDGDWSFEKKDSIQNEFDVFRLLTYTRLTKYKLPILWRNIWIYFKQRFGD